MGAIQRRVGPNVVGFQGLGQPFADGLKLLLKQTVIPTKSNEFIFVISPILALFFSLIMLSVIPFNSMGSFNNSNINLLILFMISSFNVYSVLLGGWSSNSKYAFLGAIRSASQMISYEVILFFSLIPILYLTSSANIQEIVFLQRNCWIIFIYPGIALIFFLGMLAELNRAPFDLPEAEAELVAGFNVEYSSMSFALFFLGEYGNIIIMSSLFALLFLGGWFFPIFVINFNYIIESYIMSIKLSIVSYLIVGVRAYLPRMRFDQLMALCWKHLLLLTIGTFSYYLGVYNVFYAYYMYNIGL